MISTDDSKVEQPMAKTLARHPLVLLDQQLKNLAKDEVLTKADQPQNNPTQVESPLPPEFRNSRPREASTEEVQTSMRPVIQANRWEETDYEIYDDLLSHSGYPK